jgi:hypothetical protein
MAVNVSLARKYSGYWLEGLMEQFLQELSTEIQE